jgi:hypothetical protein
MNDKVKDFYSTATGWNMFDQRYLTEPLMEFIGKEHLFVQELFATCSEYKGILEIGCGYGRFMNWAICNEVDYDGLDLVPWLVDIGLLRQQKLKKLFQNAWARVHNLPAEHMGKVLYSNSCSREHAAKLLIFPFNCFGNIANLKEVMKALAASGQDVLISTYRTDPFTSASRKAYYRKCGFTKVEIQGANNGILLTSAEGLHAIAYTECYLRELFEEYGYNLAYKVGLGSIGLQYHFKALHPNSRSYHSNSNVARTTTTQTFPHAAPENKVQLPHNISDEASCISLSALTDELSTATSNGNLLMFDRLLGVLLYADNSNLLVRSTSKLPEGTIVRVALCKGEKHNRPIDVVVCATTVDSVCSSSDNGFDMTLKLFRTTPAMSAWWKSVALHSQETFGSSRNMGATTEAAARFSTLNAA